jgi:hypothetical protein
LRKLGEEKTLELLDRHHHWHAPPSEAATDLDDYGQMKKITPRSAHIPAWRNARSRDAGMTRCAAFAHQRCGARDAPAL